MEKKVCSNCKSNLIISECSITIPAVKVSVKAFCPVCNSQVFEGSTNGWFYVQLDTKEVNITECVYPMP